MATDEKKGKSPCLMDLPIEILQHIATFLPNSSAAALALCSHSVSRVLGTQYWEKLRGPHQEGREDLPSLLEKDLPDYISCQRCATLRGSDRRGIAEIILSFEQRRPCLKAELIEDTFHMYPTDFRFAHVQMAMKNIGWV